VRKCAVRLITRHPFWVVAVWLILVIGAGAAAGGAFGGGPIFTRLESSEPRVPGSDSDRAATITEDSVGANVTLLVTKLRVGEANNANKVAPLVNDARTDLVAIDGVDSVLDPWALGWGTPMAEPLLAEDGSGFLIRVTIDSELREAAKDEASQAVTDRLNELGASVTGKFSKAEYVVSSLDLIVKEINAVMERDLMKAEGLALPISLVVMVFVFGGLLAAGMPIIGALASITGALGIVLAVSYLMKLDAVTINVVTVIGLGLSIDYGLLMVSRFREELVKASVAPEGGPSRLDPGVHQAVRRTVATAGRTVAFSALTIAISVAGLMLMSPPILRGMGVAAASVVVFAMLTATTLLPAVLTLVGRRLVRPSVLMRWSGFRWLLVRLGDVGADQGAFSALAGWVQRHAWSVMIGVVALLAVALVPLGSLQLRNAGVEMLPAGGEQEHYLSVIEEQYPVWSDAEAYLVTKTEPSREELDDLLTAIGDVDGVEKLDAPVQLDDEHTLIQIRLDVADPGGVEATRAVTAIRALNEPIWVGGTAAGQMDFIRALAQGLPAAGSLVAAATFVLLFFMTGSALVPIKALITNVVSIGASLGVTSWIFTTEHGFAKTGLESYVVALVAAFGFGLAMDYEVFLLDRIKEFYNHNRDNNASVRLGLQRSGRIITSAASVIVVVFLGFATGSMDFIKQVGVALAIVVVLDATLVRMLLVPATMTVLGDANWWAPRVLHRVGGAFTSTAEPRRSLGRPPLGAGAPPTPRRVAGEAPVATRSQPRRRAQ
jgi:putative drug exporter of the RND superfamily